MKRPNGHYWVNKNGRWIVAEYDSNYGWYIPGREEVYEMNEFNLISNNPIIEPTAEANANTVLGDVAATDLRCCGNCSNHTCIIIGNNPQNELCRLEFKSDKPRKHRISNEICSEWNYDGIKHNERLIEYKSHIT